MPRPLDPWEGVSPRIYLSIPQWLLDAIDTAATADNKTRPQMIRSLLCQALGDHPTNTAMPTAPAGGNGQTSDDLAHRIGFAVDGKG